MLVFAEKRKPENPRNKARTNNKLNPHDTLVGIEPGHIGERRALSLLRQHCSPYDDEITMMR